MANYQFSADLVSDILFRAGEMTDGSSDFSGVALQYLNRAYQALILGGGEVSPENNEDWWWAKKQPPGVINMTSAIDTGTLTATNNSTAITFSSAPAVSVAGYFIRMTGHPDIFRIAAHTAATTSATLDSVFTGTSGAGQAFTCFKTEYDLPADCIRVMAPMRIYQGDVDEVEGVELSILERDWPMAQIQSGPPSQFAYATETKLRFNTYGPRALSTPNMIRLEFDYIYRPADLTNSGSEEPIVPRMYRKLLADIAVTFLFLDKNDDRAGAVSQVATDGIRAMVREQRSRMINYGRKTGKIITRPEQTARLRRPLRTDSGVIIG